MDDFGIDDGRATAVLDGCLEFGGIENGGVDEKAKGGEYDKGTIDAGVGGFEVDGVGFNTGLVVTTLVRELGLRVRVVCLDDSWSISDVSWSQRVPLTISEFINFHSSLLNNHILSPKHRITTLQRAVFLSCVIM